MARAEPGSVRQSREFDALRIVALARLGVAALMIAAIVVGAKPKWPQFDWVPWAYGAVAIGAAVLLFGGSRERLSGSRTQLVLLVIDVAAIVTYKVAAADGSYIPLLVLTLLPIMVVLDVSWRRAAAALVVIAATFAIELHTDPVMLAQAGRPAAAVVTATFAFLCCTVFLTVYSQGRRIDEISALSASRQDLLVDLMAASDEQQRLIAEYIHDGPLQSVLMARQDVVAALKQRPDEGLDRALEALREATGQMREATFELHPAVLAGAGLARAVAQLAAASSARSGIDITTDIDYPESHSADPMVFSAARELISNVVRHSQATRARVVLRVTAGYGVLDVIDDGIGMSSEAAVRRLGMGHIGLASQRARIEALGGSLRILPADVGTHVEVRVPIAAAGS